MAEVNKSPRIRTIMALRNLRCSLACHDFLRCRLEAKDGCSRMARKRSLKIGWPALCLVALFGASEAEAAGSGSLGATSTGSIEISASIATRASISGSGDIGFAGVGRATNRVAQSLCLASNSRSRSYMVAAIGGGSAGAFELSDGHRTIGYTVGWASVEGTSLSESGTANPAFEAALSRANCRDGSGSTVLIVAIEPEHLDEARAGASFTGILTLMMAPG